ncbi:hypothetical protein YC2023_024654 [Brassica napus]
MIMSKSNLRLLTVLSNAFNHSFSLLDLPRYAYTIERLAKLRVKYFPLFMVVSVWLTDQPSLLPSPPIKLNLSKIDIKLSLKCKNSPPESKPLSICSSAVSGAAERDALAVEAKKGIEVRLHFILPSSMLARLVNIYMFRCNNKMLFVTSSFVGKIPQKYPN